MAQAVGIQQNYSLRSLNTFGIDVNAHSFIEVHDEEQLREAVLNSERQPWILGGGSNILLTRDIDKLVVHNSIKGFEIISEDDERVELRIGGGEDWHDFVMRAVGHDLGGVENLALIPGRVGAAPIQNIGAYGIELKDVFIRLEAIDLSSGETSEFDGAQCAFGYRNSIFKREAKGKYCITRVVLSLSKRHHNINTSYGAIKSTLESNSIDVPTIEDVAKAVIAIRSSKLPDPAVLGNSGSFFKNPVVDHNTWERLNRENSNLVFYPDSGDTFKIPAGWLIDQCGWKGKRVGNVGCYEKQALVIVNYGGASGQEVLDHAMNVQASVREKFGVEIEPEVNIL